MKDEVCAITYGFTCDSAIGLPSLVTDGGRGLACVVHKTSLSIVDRIEDRLEELESTSRAEGADRFGRPRDHTLFLLSPACNRRLLHSAMLSLIYRCRGCRLTPSLDVDHANTVVPLGICCQLCQDGDPARTAGGAARSLRPKAPSSGKGSFHVGALCTGKLREHFRCPRPTCMHGTRRFVWRLSFISAVAACFGWRPLFLQLTSSPRSFPASPPPPPPSLSTHTHTPVAYE